VQASLRKREERAERERAAAADPRRAGIAVLDRAVVVLRAVADLRVHRLRARFTVF
jgi:hypothetical protein